VNPYADIQPHKKSYQQASSGQASSGAKTFKVKKEGSQSPLPDFKNF